MSLHTFNVYQHADRSTKAVKVGFSWPCLFFGIFWLGAKRLWALLGFLVSLTAISYLVEGLVHDALPTFEAGVFSLLLNVAFMVGWVVFSNYANGLWASSLDERGYELLATIEAAHPDAAISQALSGNTDQQQGSAVVSTSSSGNFSA
ncbi:Protein of unknown function (DUF2628) [Marinobacter subterrani]|uniref:DUF2628 domain-containing protein n=2 Tax=Marinobacter subterrani TaxID=1658765 RepID=A0A0J7JDX7_9GAMM|nr:Protein of unknown function (DUF2628) [Marinobacter subterrani]